MLRPRPLAKLSSAGSKRVRAAARLALGTREARPAAWSKYAEIHAPCHDGVDSCARTTAECRKVLG